MAFRRDTKEVSNVFVLHEQDTVRDDIRDPVSVLVTSWDGNNTWKGAPYSFMTFFKILLKQPS